MANRIRRTNRKGKTASARLLWALILAAALIVVIVVALLIHNKNVKIEADTQGFEALQDGGETTGEGAEGFAWNGEEAEQITDEDAVVAEFSGIQLRRSEVLDTYNEIAADEVFGSNELDAGEVISAVATRSILRLKAEELGLTALTEEESTALDAQAQTDYETEAAFWTEQGEEVPASVTVEAARSKLETELWQKKLYDYVQASVTVTEEESRAAYDALVQEQSAITAEEAVRLLNVDAPVAVVPDGIREVKAIFIPFEDDSRAMQAGVLFEEIAALDPAQDSQAIMEKNDALRELFADLDLKADAIYERLNQGEAFETLCLPESLYVCAGSCDVFSAEFVEGAMMLEQPGQMTAVAMRSEAGEYIIRYEGNVPAGTAAYEAVKTALDARLLENKAGDAYTAQVQKWTEEAGLQIYPDAFA